MDNKKDIGKVQDKLNKLMKLRDGALEIGSQNEAENASKRIQELLLKYNLEESDIETKEEKPIDSTLVSGEFLKSMGWKKTDAGWRETLLSRIAKYNLCLVVFEGDGYFKGSKWIKTAPGVRVFGREVNRDTVIALWTQLIPVIDKMGRERFNEYKDDISEKRNTFLRGYYRGCVQGISNQLYNQQKEMMQINQKMDALVITEDKLVDTTMNQFYGNSLKKARSSSLSGVNGGALGRSDGSKMDIASKGSSSLRLNS